MINLSPWLYRNLLSENDILTVPEFFEITLLNGSSQFEATVSLKEIHRPKWLNPSEIYKNCDGSGTSQFKNIAVYKAISEALERMAFYTFAENYEKKYCFDVNPTTTGMACYPSLGTRIARTNAITEAVERWAIHEFNKFHIPIVVHNSNIKKLIHYELKVPYKNIRISLLVYKNDKFCSYGFAGGSSLMMSFSKALIELDRNIRVLNSVYNQQSRKFSNSIDSTLFYYSTDEGYLNFNKLVKCSPRSINNTSPKILCDSEIKGEWTKYATVWRYLLEDSYFDCSTDKTFFMF